jgi:glycosyltransferase involved in cell wall biosynthesis
MTACRSTVALQVTKHVEGELPGRDLIFVSLENWDEVWRRNQFLCDTLAGRFPKSKILFVAPPRDVSNSVRRGKLREVLSPATWHVSGRPNITVTRPLKLAPNSLSMGQRANEAMAIRHIRVVAAGLGMTAPVLWLNPHHAVSMVGRLGESAVIYDITDDWTQFDQSSRETRLIVAQDEELCRRADAVIVCSERLFQKKRPLAPNLHLIPNGVHVDHYDRVLDRNLPKPPETASWRKPVLGYTGTVHPSRVDVDLIVKTARSFPDGCVALVGPDFLPPSDAARLDALGNVHRVPPVPYSRIPDYMRAFDVCIVPHRTTAFTESLNPIKLWEYLAAGKPIASTMVPGFRDYPRLVHLGADTDGFIAAIDEALREDASTPALRREEARNHSWDKRIDAVLSVIESCVHPH